MLENYFQRMRNPGKKIEEPTQPRSMRRDRRGKLVPSLTSSLNKHHNQDDTKENGKIEKKKKKHLGHLYHAAKHIDFDSESNASSDVTTDENIQVFGPTTRRKWTEWTAKPAPSASPSSPEKTENSQDGEEHREKLRQRQMARQERRARTEARNNMRQKQDNLKEEEKKQARRRKALGAAVRSKAVLKNKARQKVLALDSLNLLHNHTLLSTSTEKQESHPNYNEPSMTAQSNSFFKPSVQPQTVSALEMAPAVQQLMDLMRQQFMQYLMQMQTPQYREQISKQIDREKLKQIDLNAKVTQLEKQIENLQTDSMGQLRSRLKELDLQVETPTQFIEQARGILTQQNKLENLAQILHSQIEQLEKENKRLSQFQQQAIIQHSITSGKVNGKKNGFTQVSQTQEYLIQEVQESMNHKNKLLTKAQELEAQVKQLEQQPTLIDQKPQLANTAINLLTQGTSNQQKKRKYESENIEPGTRDGKNLSSAEIVTSALKDHQDYMRANVGVNEPSRNTVIAGESSAMKGHLIDNNPNLSIRKLLENTRPEKRNVSSDSVTKDLNLKQNGMVRIPVKCMPDLTKTSKPSLPIRIPLECLPGENVKDAMERVILQGLKSKPNSRSSSASPLPRPNSHGSNIENSNRENSASKSSAETVVNSASGQQPSSWTSANFIPNDNIDSQSKTSFSIDKLVLNKRKGHIYNGERKSTERENASAERSANLSSAPALQGTSQNSIYSSEAQNQSASESGQQGKRKYDSGADSASKRLFGGQTILDSPQSRPTTAMLISTANQPLQISAIPSPDVSGKLSSTLRQGDNKAWTSKPTADFDALVAHASEERNRSLNNSQSDERLFKSFDEPNRAQVSSTNISMQEKRGKRNSAGSPPRRSKSPPSSPKRRRKSDSADKRSQSASCSRSRSASSRRSSSSSSCSRSTSRSSRSRSSSCSSVSSDEGKAKEKTESKKTTPKAENKSKMATKTTPPSVQPSIQQLPKYTLHLQNTTSIQNTIMYTTPVMAQKGYKVTTNPVSSASSNKLPTAVKIVNSSNLSGGGVKFLTGLNNQSSTSQSNSVVPLQMAFLSPSSNGVAQGYQVLFAGNPGLSFQPVSNSSSLQALQNRRPSGDSKSKQTAPGSSSAPALSSTSVMSSLSSVVQSRMAKTQNNPNLNLQSSASQIPNLNVSGSASSRSSEPSARKESAPGSTSAGSGSVASSIPKVVTSVSNGGQAEKSGDAQSNTQPLRTSTPFTVSSIPRTASAPPKPRAPSRNQRSKQPPSASHIPQYGTLVSLNSNLFTVANPVYGLSSNGIIPDFSKAQGLETLSRGTVLPMFNPNPPPPPPQSVSPTSRTDKTQNHTPAHANTAPKISPYGMTQQFSGPPGAVDPRSLLTSPVPRIPHYSSATSPGKTSERPDDHFPNRPIQGPQGLLLQTSISSRLPSNSATFSNGGQGYSRSQYSIEQQGLPTVIGLRPEQAGSGGRLHLQGFQSVPGPGLVPDQRHVRPGFQVYAPRGWNIR